MAVERVEVLLLIAALVSIVARRLKLPYTVGLVLAGGAIALTGISFQFELSRSLIFTVFLPPLIFEAAYQIPWNSLRKDMGVLSALATFGVAVSAALAAVGMHFAAKWGWNQAILFGVLIAATDPVAVIATLKEHPVNRRIRLLLEADSLLNDGTAAVMFGVALAAITGGHPSAGSVGLSFLVQVAGGICCGVAVAFAILALVGRTTDHLVEIAFSTIAAYGSFLIADRLGMSGVLSTMAVGVVLGNSNAFGGFTAKGREFLVDFWEFSAFVVNSLVFLLIGSRLAERLARADWLSLVWAILAVLVARAIAVYGTCLPFRWSKRRVPLPQQHLLVWGGLRGALALALALSLPEDFPGRDAITAAAFGVVAFSVVVQGLTFLPVLKACGLQAEAEPPSKQV